MCRLQYSQTKFEPDTMRIFKKEKKSFKLKPSMLTFNGCHQGWHKSVNLSMSVIVQSYKYFISQFLKASVS